MPNDCLVCGIAKGRVTVFTAQCLVSGFPGRSATHGGFGWSSVWLLISDKRRVLLETGPPAYVPILLERFRQLDIGLDSVTDILITHSHWDHLSNFAMFSNAAVWLGRSELAWARNLSPTTPFQSKPHLDALMSSGRLQLLDAEEEVFDSIVALGAAGHTPGHLAFLVPTGDGQMVFCGDSAKNLQEIATGRAESSLSAEQSASTIARLRRWAMDEGALLVPGHDVALRYDPSGSLSRLSHPEVDMSYLSRRVNDFVKLDLS